MSSNGVDNSFPDLEPDPAVVPSADSDAGAAGLEQEIGQIREHVGDLVTELDHRRHRLSPAAIIRRNKWPLAIGGAILVGAVIGGVAWRRVHAKRSPSLVARGKRLGASVRASLSRVVGGEPEAVAVKRPSIGIKILTAAATAAAVVAARRLATRFFARVW